jgi:hypothetical protein
MTVEGAPEPVAETDAVAGRRRRKTLAPADLKPKGAAPSATASVGSPVGSRFEVLVEEVTGDSSDESCASEVPHDAAIEVLESPTAPGWSTVVQRGRRTDD